MPVKFFKRVKCSKDVFPWIREMHCCEQAAQLAISIKILRQENKVMSCIQGYLTAENGLNTLAPAGGVETNSPCQSVVVCKGYGRHLELSGAPGQFPGRGGSILKTKVGMYMKMHKHLIYNPGQKPFFI
jgi:hypothetical protein